MIKSLFCKHEWKTLCLDLSGHCLIVECNKCEKVKRKKSWPWYIMCNLEPPLRPGSKKPKPKCMHHSFELDRSCQVFKCSKPDCERERRLEFKSDDNQVWYDYDEDRPFAKDEK